MTDRAPESVAKPWYKEGTYVDLLSLVLSILSLVATASLSVWLFYRQETDTKLTRSIKEIDWTYDREFVNSLSHVLSHAYQFTNDPKLNELPKTERFEAFWNTFADDADMIAIATRLGTIANCYRSDDCIPQELLSRFSDIVYESLFYVREFVFLDDDLAKVNQQTELYGWWLDKDIYGFLADYCVYRKAEGGVDLWDERYERQKTPGVAVIDPCLDPTGMH